MTYKPTRRTFLQVAMTVPLLLNSGGSPVLSGIPQKQTSQLKTSLNAFSFNEPLSAGKMNIDDMIKYCVTVGFQAVDITGYYFKGYPAIPPDDYLYHIKRLALQNGVAISGTGVRNDFTEPDTAKRRDTVKLVKGWIEVAHKIGAPVIRVFAGNQQPAGYTRPQMLEWMLKDIAECVEHGAKFGVVVGLQNHNDFIKTGDQALEMLNAVKSDWLGLILDTGSYREGDPYEQIAKTASRAVNWQIKEKVFINGKEVDVEMDKLIDIIQRSGYRGYIPLETLGEGDPVPKIANLFSKITTSLAKL